MEMLKMRVRELPTIDIYSNIFIQPYFSGRGAIGGNDVWYHHKEFLLFSSFPSFLFLFRSPKALSATSKSLLATFVILPAAFEALPAAFEDLSATS